MSKSRLLSTVAILLVLVFGLGALPASAGTVSDEPVTLTWFFPTNPSWQKLVTDLNEIMYFQEAEKITGVHIDWQVPPLGQEKEQFNLMINSGDLPDLIMHDTGVYSYPGGGDKAIEDGAYLRLNELIEEYAPNYWALINSTDNFRSESKTDEGNIWGFSMVEANRQGAWTGMAIRQDWLDQLGLATPVTFDDWHSTLTAFKDELGAEAPLLIPTTGLTWDDSLIAGFDVGKSFFKIDDVVKFGPIEEGYRDYLTTLNQWYSEGLIDKDFSTRTAESTDALIYNNKAGAWHEGFYMLNQRTKLADSDTFHLVGIAAPVRNVGDKAHLRQSNNYVRGYETSISATCKTPEIAAKYLDFAYSPEGFMLSNYGIEGMTYELDEAGTPYLTDMMLNDPNGLSINETIHYYLFHHGPMNRVWDRDKDGYTDDENACEAIWGTADDSYVMPPVTRNADEGSRYATIMADVEAYVNEMTVKFINGMASLDEYDAFVEQIKSMGIEEAIGIQQTALDRFLAR